MGKLPLQAWGVLLLTLCSAVLADVPPLVNFQGKLTDAQGAPLPEAPRDFVFRIYDGEIAGNLLWQEAHPNVLTQGGVYAVLLGGGMPPEPLTPAVFGGGDRFLEVEVEGEILSPRRRIASVPYAQVTNVANNVDGAIYTADNGNVGIGTTVPSSRLHIRSDTSSAAGKLILQSSTNDTPASAHTIAWWNDNGSEIAAVSGSNATFDGFLTFSTYDTSLKERLRIDPNGNVGIGTTNPQRQLDVAGIARVRTLAPATAAHLCWDSVSGDLASCTGSGSSAQVFESSEFPLVTDTATSVAHGLGGMPTFWSFSIRCKTPEWGYAVGDEVVIFKVDTNGSNMAAEVWANTTDVGFVWTDNDNRVKRRDAGQVGNSANITPNNWRAVLRAVRLQ